MGACVFSPRRRSHCKSNSTASNIVKPTYERLSTVFFASIFKPLPSARLSGVRPVTAGLKVVTSGGQSVSLEGEKEAIQIHVEFVPSGNYEADSHRT